MQGICGTFFNLISFHSAHRMVAFFEFEYHVSVIKTCLKSERPISTKHARFVQASPLFCENKIPVKIVFVFMAGIFYMCQRL